MNRCYPYTGLELAMTGASREGSNYMRVSCRSTFGWTGLVCSTVMNNNSVETLYMTKKQI